MLQVIFDIIRIPFQRVSTAKRQPQWAHYLFTALCIAASAPLQAGSTSAASLGANVALSSEGGVASASSTLSGHPVSSVNNNERTGGSFSSGLNWADATFNSLPDWVQINFSGVKTIDLVVLYTMQDNYNAPIEPSDNLTFSKLGVTGFNVQTWDGSNWVTQAVITGNNLVKRSVPFTPVATDRIRINVTGNRTARTYLTEIEAWNSLPLPPVIGTAAPGNRSASIAFTPGGLGRGSLLNYTVDCGNGIIATGTSSPVNVPGLINGDSYTCKVKTLTSIGESEWSALSNLVRPSPGECSAEAPDAPLISQANAGYASISVHFSPRALKGGNVVRHVAECAYLNSGHRIAVSATGLRSPITVTGLATGQVYTCRARTITDTCNLVESDWSDESNPLVPGPTGGNIAAAWKRGLAYASSSGLVYDTIAPGINPTAGVASKRQLTEQLKSGLTATPTSTPATRPVRASVLNNGELNGHSYGRTESTWFDDSPNLYPDNVQVEFDPIRGTQIISKVVLYTRQDVEPDFNGNDPADDFRFSRYGVRNFDVQIWDGATWVTQATVLSNGLVKRTVSFPPVATDRIRVVTNGGTDVPEQSYITEVQAWATSGATPPMTPAIGIAKAGNASASVAFTPDIIGTGTLLAYTADCGSITASGTASPIKVNGLRNGVAYTCKVKTTSRIDSNTIAVGQWSAPSNTVTPAAPIQGYAPWAPTIGTTTLGNFDAVIVSFTPSATTGSGNLINYTANCGGIIVNGSGSPITVPGIPSHKLTSCAVKANSSAGPSPWSEMSNYVRPVYGESAFFNPDIPIVVNAYPGDASAVVEFTPQASGDGFYKLHHYTANCGGFSAVGDKSPIVVQGLSNNHSYTCKVQTVREKYDTWSEDSNPVTPKPEAAFAGPPVIIGGYYVESGVALFEFIPGLNNLGDLIDYEVDCGGITSTGAFADTETQTLRINATGLLYGATYLCKVRAITTIGAGPWSALFGEDDGLYVSWPF